MSLKKFVVTVFALALYAPAYAQVNFDSPNGNNIKEALRLLEAGVPAVFPAQANKPSKAEKWTIMVYINGKNNLESFALKDMNEMELIGSSGKINIVAELGRIDGYSDEDGDWTGARRYLVKKDGDTGAITSPVVRDLGGTDMGDYKNLVDFGNWAKAAYPAEHYLLIVWNHGSGWEKDVRAGRPKGISYDEETGGHITTPQLGEALRQMGGVDVYGSDACLMQMAEVVYELKGAAGYIVGSEETEPGDGYTYNAFLRPIVKKPSMSPAEVARTVVNAYSDHYAAVNQNATQSYVNAEVLTDLPKLVNDWTAAVEAAGEKRLVKKALANAQSFRIQENKDLYHFAEIITGGTKDKKAQLKGLTLLEHISGKLVGANRPVGYDYANAHGIAVYLPDGPAGSDYGELQWAKDSGWTQFINWYSRE